MLRSALSRLAATRAASVKAAAGTVGSPVQHQNLVARFMSQETKAKPKRRFFKTKIALGLWALAGLVDLAFNDDWDTIIDKFRFKLTDEQRKDRPHVVILGTGWGALSAIRKMRPDLYNITIISPRNYFLFTPLLPSTTTGVIETRCIIEPIRDYCVRANGAHAQFYEAECVNIDPDTNTVTCVNTIDGTPAGTPFKLQYDHLVVAVGTQSATFNIPGVKEHALFMKEARDGRRLRQRIMDVLERVNCPDAVEPQVAERLLHFVVVGGGPTGVECAAELHDFVVDEVARYFPQLKDKVKITLIEALPNVLSMFSTSLVEYATEKFKRENIDVKTKSLVVKVDDDTVSIKSLETGQVSTMPYGTLLWASGVAVRPVISSLIKSIGADKGQTNPKALAVDKHLRVVGTNNIWAIGDCAFNGHPPTAQVASQEGKYLGRMLKEAAGILNQDKLHHNHEGLEEYLKTKPEFQYNHMGAFAYIGDTAAIADFGKSKDDPGLFGTSAGTTTYFLWRSVYFTKLLSYRNRMLISSNWLFTYLFGRDTSRNA
eukprot:comp9869_c0_seq1/m.4806 comp9869_c0_seq1/g.4806  ORF comp9869_c0_seq1/g.4806 comp9869_c0_seq1/m.4806 type:complete len:544 (-) comp9869_c0_seq1:487-2118(-)